MSKKTKNIEAALAVSVPQWVDSGITNILAQGGKLFADIGGYPLPKLRSKHTVFVQPAISVVLNFERTGPSSYYGINERIILIEPSPGSLNPSFHPPRCLLSRILLRELSGVSTRYVDVTIQIRIPKSLPVGPFA